MRELFVLFTYFSFSALAFTCSVITYQIIRYGVGKTSGASENDTDENK